MLDVLRVDINTFYLYIYIYIYIILILYYIIYILCMNKAGVWMCGCVQNDMLSPVLESRFNKVADMQ